MNTLSSQYSFTASLFNPTLPRDDEEVRLDRDDVMLARDVAMEILEEEMSDAVSDPLRSSFEVGRVMAGRSSRRP